MYCSIMAGTIVKPYVVGKQGNISPACNSGNTSVAV